MPSVVCPLPFPAPRAPPPDSGRASQLPCEELSPRPGREDAHSCSSLPQALRKPEIKARGPGVRPCHRPRLIKPPSSQGDQTRHPASCGLQPPSGCPVKLPSLLLADSRPVGSHRLDLSPSTLPRSAASLPPTFNFCFPSFLCSCLPFSCFLVPPLYFHSFKTPGPRILPFGCSLLHPPLCF